MKLSKILKDYLDIAGIRITTFASIIGITPTSLRLMLRDKHSIHRGTAERIVRGTRNRITKEMLEPFIYIKKTGK